jgi:oxygen-independent coproporphyrinogen-3 oxidase
VDGTNLTRRSLAAYDRPVPRYTSYPTAAQFHGGIGPADHRGWLAALPDARATLYLHVPFCRQLCWYCACNTSAMNRKQPLEDYARALIREIDLVAEAVPHLLVGTIQWGGGTPSQLGAARLAQVSRHLAGRFDRATGSETSVEVDPRYCDEAFVAAMTDAGVTRVSLGVQDFDIEVQEAINRLQSVEVTGAAIGRFREAGVRHVNIDLVYGLPRQTLDSLSRTLDVALAIRPDRFAVFGYAHVPWMKARQQLIDVSTLPGLPERAAMAELVAERLVAAGYHRIGLDHFALPTDPLASAAGRGQLRRSFQGYVAEVLPSVVGLGASAISSLPQGFVQNTSDFKRYQSAIAAGLLATERGVATHAEDRLRAEIIDRLMCNFSADLGEICRRHEIAVAPFLAGIAELPALIDDGLVRLDGDRLRVTDRGQSLVRFVCAAFDQYLAHGKGRHSSGI